jgi:hypothetical protein
MFLDIINIGRSPAFLTGLNAAIELIGDGQEPPELKPSSAFNPLILSSKDQPEDRFGSYQHRSLTNDEFDKINDGEAAIWVYGIAEYFDTGKNPHFTKFCGRWYVLEDSTCRFDPVGPPGWTEYT